jgi:hypothetical protein
MAQQVSPRTTTSVEEWVELSGPASRVYPFRRHGDAHGGDGSEERSPQGRGDAMTTTGPLQLLVLAPQRSLDVGTGRPPPG